MQFQGRLIRFRFVAVAALFACLGTANSAHAAIVNYTFLQEQGPGSSLTYQGDVSGYSANVTAWADLGTGTLEETAIAHELANGLGVCNSGERAFARCASKKNSGPMDNMSQHDWLLVYFDELVNVTSFTVYTNRDQNGDVTYFTGLLEDANEVANFSYLNMVADRSAGGLGLTRYDAGFTGSSVGGTVRLAEVAGADVWGNFILVGASLTTANDRLMLNSVSTLAVTPDPSVVPIPAAVWLFGSALFGLFACSRLNS